MSLSLVLAFWMVSLLVVLTPGADWAYTINAGLRYRSPVPAVSGIVVGYLLAAAVVAAGLGAVVLRTPSALTVITIAGAAYLVWLGVDTLRHPAGAPTAVDGPLASVREQWLKGVGTSGLNPKMMLLFVAVLPQFTLAGSPVPVGAQMMALAGLHTASCAAVYFALGYASRRMLTLRPQAARAVSLFSGVAMIGLGCALLLREVL